MYKAIDVARHIINYSNEKRYGISNLKLQKLLYMVQAYYLVKTDEHKPCFDDRIVAWDFGPVVQSVYAEYKGYAGLNILPIRYYYMIVCTMFLLYFGTFPFCRILVRQKNNLFRYRITKQNKKIQQQNN